MDLSNPNLNDLNSSQRRAVEYDDGHLLIAAGPGTGKTHTLTHRIIRLLSRLSRDEKVLAVTFTNKAADEMRERLTKRLDTDLSRVHVGTFHSFCLDVLRQFGSCLDLPGDFRVASQDDAEALVKQVWPDVPGRERKTRMKAVTVWKETSLDDDEPEEVCTYNRMLRKKSFLDFDDLLRETLQLLRRNENVRVRIQKTYRFICVDEYQDINRIQHVLLKLIAGGKGQITAIGDPNQAIYGFRGSDVRFFESFRDDFPGAEVLELSENYRSTENLLKASGQVIRKSGLSVPELTARLYKQGHLTVHEAPTERAEAEYVVHSIERMVGGTSMFSQDSGRVVSGEDAERSFADIAVLYRLNSQGKILQEAFDRSGIPYQISGEKPFEESVDFTAEKVNLMTLHAVKGLEFPVVFIVGCEENVVPLRLEGFKTDAEEERRLFYVGMTRAKERLYLVHSKQRMLYGKKYADGPSSFLKDIEEELKSYDTPHSSSGKRRPKQQEQQMSLFDSDARKPRH